MLDEGKKNIRGFFFFLGSLKTGLFLLSLIIVFSIVGTFIPQGLSPEKYIQNYGETAYSFFRLFRLTSLYYSWWFITLLVLLGLNLILCTVQRIPFKKASLILIHFSLLVILSGSVVTAIFSENGIISLNEGETVSRFFSRGGYTSLPFSLTLNDFEIDFYKPEYHRIGAYCPDMEQGGFCDLKPGETCQLRGSDYSILLKKYFPDLGLDSGGAVNRSENPRNPAVLIEITKGKDKEERWIFADYPAMMPVEFSDLKLAYVWQAPVKEYSSYLTVKGEKGTREEVVRVNQPLRCQDYIIYQMNYDPEDLEWTGLRVKKDPGAKVIFIGFLILNLSVLSFYYGKIKARNNDV